MMKRLTFATKNLFIIFVLFIVVDISLIIVFLVAGSKVTTLDDDLLTTFKLAMQSKFPLIILDSEVLGLDRYRLDYKSDKRTVMLGTDLQYNFNKIDETELLKFVKMLEDSSFRTAVFYNYEVGNKSSNWKIPVAFMWKREVSFHCVILYTREANTWWFGNFMNDPTVKEKLFILGLDHNGEKTNFEGLLNKMELVTLSLPILGSEVRTLMPKYPASFLENLADSLFIECNTSRGNSFIKKFYKKSPFNKRFRHKAWKLLSKAKTVLDHLSIKFWLSSGTCLGYYRECSIIPHSMDVDIGIFASDYSNNIIPQMEAHGLSLKHWFGTEKDSLELSFIDVDGLKLDIFFFYDDGEMYWNGGTQAKSGQKFKYSFPKFTLCWTIFLELKVRVPCDTLSYISANYGPHWDIPVIKWDWKTSPFNVKTNGFWPKNMWSEVIRVYT